MVLIILVDAKFLDDQNKKVIRSKDFIFNEKHLYNDGDTT